MLSFYVDQEYRDPQTWTFVKVKLNKVHIGNVSSMSTVEAFGNNAQNEINDDVPPHIIKHLNIHGLIAILNYFSGNKNHFSSYSNRLKENVSFNLLKTNQSCL